MRWKFFFAITFLLFVAACSKTIQIEPPCTSIHTTAHDPDSDECVVFPTNCTPPGWKLGCTLISEISSTSVDKTACRSSEDCVCGGIDRLTNDCFIGNREYSRAYVDRTRSCPDFCGGQNGMLVPRCVEGKCSQTEGSMSEISCTQTQGIWTDCTFGCGPLTYGQRPKDNSTCSTQCTPQCRCPAERPYWEDDMGCLDENQVAALYGSECAENAGCAQAGCSGEICATKEAAQDIVTICEWKEEYAHVNETCACVRGYCKWATNN